MKRAALWITLALATHGAARAQEGGARGGAVRGVVRSTAQEPIPYAVVALTPGYGQRFTDETGAFAIPNVSPGTYHFGVRQVGFRPFDTTVVKVANTPLSLTVTLERLAVELAEITVVASRRCTTPGPPDSVASPELASIFAQLRQNAERYAFLADSYPFRYRIARTFADYDNAGQVLWTATDTLQYQSNARARYQPGDVVGFGAGPSRTTARILKLPTLADLADSSFLASHCFAFAGTSRQNGVRVVRFEFRPADTLRMADLEGDVALDAQSYQVRHATVKLTRAGRAMPGLLSAADTMTFTELYPNIVLPSLVEGTLVPAPEYGVRKRVGRSTEVQRLLDVHFLRALPGRRSDGPS